jgi:maltooligosyltrehalose trehalohydrolase
MSEWKPALGAITGPDGTRFRLWAPTVDKVELVLEDRAVPLSKDAQGYFSAEFPDVRAGTLYCYRVDGKGPFPDPVSRFQPRGVHDVSETVDPAFPWTDGAWQGVPRNELVIYELHTGTFTPEGTFAAATEKLPFLTELGVTAVEIMPIADFPGGRNWGYDGVSLYAPARCYGKPADLRRLVDRAHALGLAVIIDVVYNHLGPDGNYTGVYSPFYLTRRHKTPWGDALNFDSDHAEHVREFFIQNALHWIHEYHADGLRLDAVHAIADDSPKHFLAELAERVRGSVKDRRVHVIAEDNRNLAALLKPPPDGWGLDGVWADGFHHQIRVCLAGDRDGYYQDYTGSAADIAETMRKGWFYCGQFSAYAGEPRGTDPSGLSHDQFVICIQNHDQVGNRALGERLHHQIDPAAYRAAVVLLLTAPETPLLFMGQEWAASSPFLYFTDHNPELGRLVTEGRREEFKKFAAFADPATRQRIPDPQAAATFEASRLKWDEIEREPHAGVLRLYKALLSLRRREPALRGAAPADVRSTENGALLVRRGDFLAVVRLRDGGPVSLPAGNWKSVIDTEDTNHVSDPAPAERTASSLIFRRPGAVVLKVQ